MTGTWHAKKGGGVSFLLLLVRPPLKLKFSGLAANSCTQEAISLQFSLF